MSIPPLPAPIQTFVDATNAGDTEAFLNVFTPDAVLNDWGREFNGPDGIARWNHTDNIGKQSQFELVAIEAGSDENSHVVTLKVSGNGFNGTGQITFQLRDDRISGVTITPH